MSQENLVPTTAEEISDFRHRFQRIWDQTYFCACLHCGSTLRMYKSQAGKRIECPQCGEAFVLPSPSPQHAISLRPAADKQETTVKLRLRIEVELRSDINVDWPKPIKLEGFEHIEAIDAAKLVEEARKAVAAQWGEKVATNSLWVHVYDAEMDTPIGLPLWYDPDSEASLQ